MNIAKISVRFSLFLLLFWGCESFKKPSSAEGIKGEVRWVEGNLMPSPDDATYAQRAAGIPLEREIFIFELANRKDAISAGASFYKAVNTKLVSRVKSRKDGSFHVTVPPGTYSVFVLIEDYGFFANTMDGENNINPVTVEPDQYTDIQIIINYKAYY